jgi:hypothetical protein
MAAILRTSPDGGSEDMNENTSFGGGMSAGMGTPGGQQGTSVKSEVKKLASDAKDETLRVASQAKEQAGDLVDRTKGQTAARLGDLAGALRQTADQLHTADAMGFGRYAGMAADQVQRASDYVQRAEPRQMLRDTETFARRHPDLFIGGAFFAGVLIARFLKSSADDAPTGLTPVTASPAMGTASSMGATAGTPGAGYAAGYSTPGVTTGYGNPGSGSSGMGGL